METVLGIIIGFVITLVSFATGYSLGSGERTNIISDMLPRIRIAKTAEAKDSWEDEYLRAARAGPYGDSDMDGDADE